MGSGVVRKKFGISCRTYWGDQMEDVASGDALYYTDLIMHLVDCKYLVYWMQEDLDKRYPVFKGMKAAERKEAYSRLYLSTASPLWPDLDYLLIQWRWKMPGRNWYASGSMEAPPNNDYLRQIEMLTHYSREDTKIFILDADYKLTEEDEQMWPDATILEVSKTPKFLTRKRKSIMWPFYFEHLADMKKSVHDPFNEKEVNTYSLDPNFLVSYIGNDYERDNQFRKYMSDVANLFAKDGRSGVIHAYGNWLKYPDKIKRNKKEYSNVVFHPKVARDAMEYIYSRTLCVPLLAKDEYALHGMMACRIYEAMYNGSIPIGFSEFNNISDYVIDELIVGTSTEFYNLIKRLEQQTPKQRTDLWMKQIKHINYGPKEFLNDIGIT